jgi:hypothetical protein
MKDTRIVGELILDAKASDFKNYRFKIHAAGEQNWCKDASGPTLENAIEKLGNCVVEKFEPLIAGFYYLHSPDKADLEKIGELKYNFLKDDDRYVWELVLRGMAWRDKTGFPKETRKYFCEAIHRKPSFTPAWRILANSLRADSAYSEAEDLALRLINLDRDEPEGYRQLGSLRSACMSDNREETDARRFFEHIIALNERKKAKDYLTLVDYARWLYSHYEPRKEYFPVEAEGTVPHQPDYLSAAAEYLEKAREHANDQQSVYTNFARAVGYPRLNSDRSTTLARFIEATSKAKAGLPLDERNAFANFVMGELLTDEGMEGHRYQPSEKAKFAEAEAYLEKAVKAAKWGEAQYEAMYARALAGQGRYDTALAQLAKFKS